MPDQKPGKSFQGYETPKVFLDAVKARWRLKGFDWDLAATRKANKALRSDNYFGPDHGVGVYRDALARGWALRGNLWLNPPFAKIEPWAKKCHEWAPPPGVEPLVRKIFFLVPAAVGSNWWANWVHQKARVIFLNGRIPFMPDKPKWGYPKDCALCVYSETPGYEIWPWRQKKAVP